LRQALVSPDETDAVRLVHGESDGLPGIVVDQYGDVVVMQCLSAGAEFWRQALIDGLVELLKPACIVERSDVDVRALEGLEQRVGVLYGQQPAERLNHSRKWSPVWH
jgi:23S rRNA (cytosine1962-C5)-methyltransferase